MPKIPAPTGPKDLKQVWFPGVHCDVGGGYPETQSGLSKIALKWMFQESEAAGLLINPVRRDTVLGYGDSEYVSPNANAELHESLKGIWWLAEFIWKRHWNWQEHEWEHRANLGRRRTIPPRSLVHKTAFERGEYYAKRLPPDAIPTT
jgi:hypothetical protein